MCIANGSIIVVQGAYNYFNPNTYVGGPQLIAKENVSVLNFTGPPVAANFNVNIPAGLRTLLLQFTVSSFSGGGITGVQFQNVEIVGNQSGYVYYNNAPYLVSPGASPFALIVCPVSGLFDTSFAVQVNYFITSTGGTSSLNATCTVYADSQIYDESVFYNGQIKTAWISTGVIGTVPAAYGPIRLLAASLNNNTTGLVFLNGGPGGGAYLSSANQGTDTSLDCPSPGIIIPLLSGVSLQMFSGAGSCYASIVYAYP